MESLGKSRGQKPLGPAAPRVLVVGLPEGLHSPRYPLGFSTDCTTVHCSLYTMQCRLSEVYLQYDSTISQTVNIRCGDLVGAMENHVVPALESIYEAERVHENVGKTNGF